MAAAEEFNFRRELVGMADQKRIPLVGLDQEGVAASAMSSRSAADAGEKEKDRRSSQHHLSLPDLFDFGQKHLDSNAGIPESA